MPIRPYDRQKAVEYAHKWAFSRNPAYYDYEHLGGDCTNFASQVIFAGSGIMNYTPVYGWYYINANNKSPSWTGVQFLYNFLVGNKGRGPFAQNVDVSRIEPGDIIQLAFTGNNFRHSPVVVAVGNPPSPENILIAAHTYDADNRPLTSYNWSSIRYIHILGSRV